MTAQPDPEQLLTQGVTRLFEHLHPGPLGRDVEELRHLVAQGRVKEAARLLEAILTVLWDMANHAVKLKTILEVMETEVTDGTTR